MEASASAIYLIGLAPKLFRFIKPSLIMDASISADELCQFKKQMWSFLTFD